MSYQNNKLLFNNFKRKFLTTNKYYTIGKKIIKLNRSLTIEGNRQTLKIIKDQFKEFKIKSIRSGRKVLIGIFHLNGLSKMLL